MLLFIIRGTMEFIKVTLDKVVIIFGFRVMVLALVIMKNAQYFCLVSMFNF